MTAGLKREFRRLLLEAVSRDNILPLTSVCNLRCVFCSHRRLPAGVDMHRFPPLPLKELAELIPFLDRHSRIVIGESATRLCEGEPFTHPDILALLGLLRRHFPCTPLQITTNGTLLGEKVVTALQRLQGETELGEPLLEMVISLNSSTAEVRRAVLGDDEPRRALDGLELCRRRGLPFHGSVVAVPHLGGWDDLEKTLLLLDTQGARTIRLFLPGYTRATPVKERGHNSLWEDVYLLRQRMSARLRCPLLLEPPLKKDLVARVEGVIEETPAAAAGLQAGDIITAVDGKNVLSAVAAFQRIKEASRPLLTVRRPAGPPARDPARPETAEYCIQLEKQKGALPGLVMERDLTKESIDLVYGAIARHKARLPLLLTSRAAAPLWQAAREQGLIPSCTCISIVPNRFFGGTICTAGLLTVSDLYRHLTSVLQEREADLLLLPGAPFDRRGLDLCGVSYRELSRAFPGAIMEILS